MDKWEVGSQLEGLTCDLELLQDLLEILFNEMDEERELMDLSNNPNLARRQRPLQSLLIAATRETGNIYTACKNLSDLLYKEGSAERKANQKQTQGKPSQGGAIPSTNEKGHDDEQSI